MLPSKGFFTQLFDAPSEIVIAKSRVILLAISITVAAFYSYKDVYNYVLIVIIILFYLYYSITILLNGYSLHLNNNSRIIIHIFDFVFISVLVISMRGMGGTFLIFFAFVLLFASLRWNWQGIVLTGACLIGLAILTSLFHLISEPSAGHQAVGLEDTTIQIAYILAMAAILAHESANRELRHARLTKIATWVTPQAAQGRAGFLGSALKQATDILSAERALVFWEDRSGASSAALWKAGVCRFLDEPAWGRSEWIAAEFADKVFSRSLSHPDLLQLPDGYVEHPNILDDAFVRSFDIRDFSSAPFSGLFVKGRLFLLGNVGGSDDQLLLTSILADRIGVELDQQMFLKQAASEAATHERMSIMRDLHDGLLQDLTAARAQLELLNFPDLNAQSRINVASELLRAQQHRLRRFIDEIRAVHVETVPLDSLLGFVEETAEIWGCRVSLTVKPAGHLVPTKIINQLSLLIAEAVANAVRHGNARNIQTNINADVVPGRMEICDDGHGFPWVSKTAEPVRVPLAESPRSLHERVIALGGQMQIWTGASGTRLVIELPV